MLGGVAFGVCCFFFNGVSVDLQLPCKAAAPKRPGLFFLKLLRRQSYMRLFGHVCLRSLGDINKQKCTTRHRAQAAGETTHEPSRASGCEGGRALKQRGGKIARW